MRPEFVDNQEVSLRDALQQHILWRVENGRNMNLDIATGYINPQAFAMLADELEQCERRFAHHMNVLDRGDAPSHTWDVRPRPRQDAGERTRSRGCRTRR